jgi:hypothetical protein
MKKRTVNLDSPSTKRDLEEMAAHIITAIAKTLEDYATKYDVRNIVGDEVAKKAATKEDLKAAEKRLGDKIDDVGSDVSDLRRRVRDLETDTVTRREFNEFKAKVLP